MIDRPCATIKKICGITIPYIYFDRCVFTIFNSCILDRCVCQSRPRVMHLCRCFIFHVGWLYNLAIVAKVWPTLTYNVFVIYLFLHFQDMLQAWKPAWVWSFVEGFWWFKTFSSYSMDIQGGREIWIFIHKYVRFTMLNPWMIG